MTKPVQHRGWISGVGLRGAISALALAVVLVLGVGATKPAHGQTLKVLYSFKGGADGANPNGGLVRDAAAKQNSLTAGFVRRCKIFVFRE